MIIPFPSIRTHLIAGCAWLACSGTACAATQADDFLAAREAFRAGDVIKLERYAKPLNDYVLEPYVAYWRLRLKAQRLIEKQNWAEAKVPLQRLVELYPQQKGGDAVYRQLATALRSLNEPAAEREVLTKWCEIDDEATEGYLRLMELATADKDWPTVARNSERYLAVNPLVPAPYRYLAQAAAETGDDSTAIVAWRTLLQLDVPERADGHFQLARLLHKRGDDVEARQQALLSLEETPRYREALKLLLELKRARRDTTSEPAPAESGELLRRLSPVSPGRQK